ncbi:hypothetical protein GARC_0287 [Paraglaciecola arctica BSs20135]|uniref:Uncharacterized protein n=1 Tax=Paraglaciecola arctica BSs20135 TaxID=493475 RepID=K6X9G5_9ALTE|nr:hypothetical protein GARC_0287 [Paraglaciecola arctica BSs20135]
MKVVAALAAKCSQKNPRQNNNKSKKAFQIIVNLEEQLTVISCLVDNKSSSVMGMHNS